MGTLRFLASAIAVALVTTSARAAERVITVEEAVDLALKYNARVRIVEAALDGGRDLERAAGARMLPSVHITNEYQHWDNDFSIPFGGSPTMKPIQFTVRDQNTNTFVAAADQPLLGLLHLSHEYSAQGRAADATEARVAVARATLREAIQIAFLRLYEAKALEDVARSSEAELTDELTVTRARLEAGVLTNADLLRVQVAAANAKQQEILARTQGEISRAQLLGALGLPVDGAGIEFAEPTSLLAQAKAPLPAVTDAERQALAARPELKQLDLEVKAADHQHSARVLSLLPEVNAEAAFYRLDGQPFQPTNAGFVGVKVVWPIWEWGASYYAARAAATQTRAAQLERASAGRQMGIDVSTDLAQARAATSAVEVAEQTIASAEEAYRVTQALVKAGSATTTDLLDAEAALTQARLNRTRAQYEQAIAQVTLARSLGR